MALSSVCAGAQADTNRVTRAATIGGDTAASTLHVGRDDLGAWAGHVVRIRARVHSAEAGSGTDRLIVGDTATGSERVVIAAQGDSSVRLDFYRFRPGDLIEATGVLARAENPSDPEWVLHPRDRGDVAGVGLTRRGFGFIVEGVFGLGALIALMTLVWVRKEQRLADRQLRESHELMRAILNGTNHLIAYINPSGLIVALNPAAAAALGIVEADAIGLPITRLFAEGSIRDRAAAQSAERGEGVKADFRVIIADVPASGSDEREWLFQRADGEPFPVSASTTALYGPAGEIRGYAMVASDITARRAAEAEIELARIAAERTSRVKSEFLANMSHELRTPLNSVIGFSNILLKNKNGHFDANDIAYLGRITANGRHLLGLINGILDLSKIEAGRIELEWGEVDASPLVRETLAELESQAVLKGVTLVAETPEHPALIRADQNRLKQMLINLIANALKFTERGSVTVCVSADASDGRVTRIDVRDTGCGIPDDRLEAVFEAFQQADGTTARQFGGTGLGLTITRSLGRLMGLDVSVTSRRDIGSTFSIVTAPPTADLSLPTGPTDRAVTPNAQRPLAVLVIDDDADARAVLAQQLRNLGCSVTTASSAADGLAQARRQCPDLITLDIMMPQVSGIAALQQIRSDPVLGNVPVVIVSIVAEEFRGRLRDAATLLEKPVSSEALAGIVRNTLPSRRQPELILLDEWNLEGVVDRLRGREASGSPRATPDAGRSGNKAVAVA